MLIFRHYCVSLTSSLVSVVRHYCISLTSSLASVVTRAVFFVPGEIRLTFEVFPTVHNIRNIYFSRNHKANGTNLRMLFFCFKERNTRYQQFYNPKDSLQLFPGFQIQSAGKRIKFEKLHEPKYCLHYFGKAVTLSHSSNLRFDTESVFTLKPVERY